MPSQCFPVSFSHCFAVVDNSSLFSSIQIGLDFEKSCNCLSLLLITEGKKERKKERKKETNLALTFILSNILFGSKENVSAIKIPQYS